MKAFAVVFLACSAVAIVRLAALIRHEFQRIRRARALHDRFNIECALCEKRQAEGDFEKAAAHIAYMQELHEAHKAVFQ